MKNQDKIEDKCNSSFSSSPSESTPSFSPENYNEKEILIKKSKKKEKLSHTREILSFKIYADKEKECENFCEEEIIPERIEGFYIHDYNILKIDDILKKKFEQDKKKYLTNLSTKLAMEKIRIKNKQNLIERKVSRKKIQEYEEEIMKYKENIDKLNYLEKSKDLIEAYKKIGPINTVVSFVSNINNKETITTQETEEQQVFRHKIISSYLEIARKYIHIDLIRNLTSQNLCLSCGINTEEIEMLEDESDSTICPNCGLETINIVKSAFYADGGRINNSRNNYEDRANFEKVLSRYQGKQITKPGKELYMKLDEHFITRGLPSSKEYNSMPLLKDGTKEGTSREMMFEALNNIGCSGYYDDINLICSVFFGWSLPDISHLEDAIMRDYDDFKSVYDQLPDREGRKSSLNSQWMLYILLKRRNWPCKSKDFKIPTTPSILEYHKIKTKEAYSILNWQCPY